jgi:nucleotide-binding universal stress UspA family protein
MTKHFDPAAEATAIAHDASFRDILVFVGPSETCEKTVRYAAEVAKAHDARLVGVYVTDEKSHHLGFVRGTDAMANAVRAAETREQREANEQGAQFLDLASQHDVRASFRIVWHDLDMNRRIVGSSLLADLVIAGLDDPEGLPEAWHPEKFTSLIGAPLLMVPKDWKGESPPKKISIAWNATKQARRAMISSIPFLRQAEEVVIITIDEDPREGIDLSLYLERHDVKAKVEHVEPDDRPIAEQILATAEAVGAEMLVMGAYSHAKAVRLVFGGTTQKVLGRTTVPVFLSR